MLQHSRMLAKVSGVGRKRLPHRARKALCTRLGQTLSSVKRRVSVFFFAASKGAVSIFQSKDDPETEFCFQSSVILKTVIEEEIGRAHV